MNFYLLRKFATIVLLFKYYFDHFNQIAIRNEQNTRELKERVSDDENTHHVICQLFILLNMMCLFCAFGYVNEMKNNLNCK